MKEKVLRWFFRQCDSWDVCLFLDLAFIRATMRPEEKIRATMSDERNRAFRLLLVVHGIHGGASLHLLGGVYSFLYFCRELQREAFFLSLCSRAVNHTSITKTLCRRTTYPHHSVGVVFIYMCVCHIYVWIYHGCFRVCKSRSASTWSSLRRSICQETAVCSTHVVSSTGYLRLSYCYYFSDLTKQRVTRT